jgi:hypothetical protein
VCEKCKEIDDQIEHYKRLKQFVTDAQALSAIDRRNDDLIEQKRLLHPEVR